MSRTVTPAYIAPGLPISSSSGHTSPVVLAGLHDNRTCVTIPATILIGVSFTPVGDHRLTASGRLGVRMKLPGLQASA